MPNLKIDTSCIEIILNGLEDSFHERVKTYDKQFEELAFRVGIYSKTSYQILKKTEPITNLLENFR